MRVPRDPSLYHGDSHRGSHGGSHGGDWGFMVLQWYLHGTCMYLHGAPMVTPMVTPMVALMAETGAPMVPPWYSHILPCTPMHSHGTPIGSHGGSHCGDFWAACALWGGGSGERGGSVALVGYLMLIADGWTSCVTLPRLR